MVEFWKLFRDRISWNSLRKKSVSMHLLDIRSTNRQAQSTVNSNGFVFYVCVCFSTFVTLPTDDDDDNRSIFQFQLFGFSYAAVAFFALIDSFFIVEKDLRLLNTSALSDLTSKTISLISIYYIVVFSVTTDKYSFSLFKLRFLKYTCTLRLCVFWYVCVCMIQIKIR